MQQFTIKITENISGADPRTATEIHYPDVCIEHYRRLVVTDDLNFLIRQLDQALNVRKRKRRSKSEIAAALEA